MEGACLFERLDIVLEQYFNFIINTEEFAIAVDSTGFYMFCYGEPDQKLIDIAEQVLDALSLDKRQCVLAFVSDYSDHDYNSFSFETTSITDYQYIVARDELEAFVRKLAGKREFIFNQEMINSIIDCFYDIPDFITPVEKQLMEIGISRDVAHNLYLNNPLNTQEVFDLGCPDPLVDEAFKIILDWYDEKAPKEELDDTAYQSIIDSLRRNAIYSWASIAAAFLFIVIGYFGSGYLVYAKFIAAAFGYMAAIFGSRSRKSKSNVAGQLGEVVGYSILIVTIFPFLIKATVFVTSYLSNLDIDYSLGEFFNDLHF